MGKDETQRDRFLRILVESGGGIPQGFTGRDAPEFEVPVRFALEDAAKDSLRQRGVVLPTADQLTNEAVSLIKAALPENRDILVRLWPKTIESIDG